MKTEKQIKKELRKAQANYNRMPKDSYDSLVEAAGLLGWIVALQWVLGLPIQTP